MEICHSCGDECAFLFYHFYQPTITSIEAARTLCTCVAIPFSPAICYRLKRHVLLPGALQQSRQWSADAPCGGKYACRHSDAPLPTGHPSHLRQTPGCSHADRPHEP